MKMFTTEFGGLVPLNADGQVTYILEMVKGDINVRPKGFVTCNGEDVRYHGRVLSQTVILQDTHFMVKKVQIRRNFDDGELMIVDTRTTILEHGGFTIDSGTYDTLCIPNNQVLHGHSKPHDHQEQAGDHQPD